MKTKIQCPSPQCSFPFKIHAHGTYFRRSEGRRIRRFRCGSCKRSFSDATGTPEYRQRKRHINLPLAKLLCSNVSLSRSADILGVNEKTVARRLPYLAKKCELFNKNLLANYPKKISCVQFDDLITKENSKCKPLTVPIAVDKSSRLILSVEVGVIPAFGHLAGIARKKYGHRKNEHVGALQKMFAKLKGLGLVEEGGGTGATFVSDDHKNYPRVLAQFFPGAVHERVKGGRGCVAGQVELKKQSFDPIFAINHTCAMLRANVCRLIRKTWCTTKKVANLMRHLRVYQWFHNCRVLGVKPTFKGGSYKLLKYLVTLELKKWVGAKIFCEPLKTDKIQ